MQTVRMLIVALGAAAAMVLPVAPAPAQPSGLHPERDCQVVRTWNFGRGGSTRGCLSAYTCRVCRFVSARCTVDGPRRVCQRMVCTWGG